MPDCCVLLAAQATGGAVATFDRRLADAARGLGLETVGCADEATCVVGVGVAAAAYGALAALVLLDGDGAAVTLRGDARSVPLLAQSWG